MHRIFLLRAYGDFVILLQAIIRSKHKGNYQLVASKHLEELYIALSSKIDISGIQIEFVEFGITKTQLGLFTNKHFARMGTLQEVKTIKAYVEAHPNQNGIDYIEQDKRIGLLNLLTGHSFEAILFEQPIYATYDLFFQNEPAKIYSPQGQINKIVLFPDSRLPKKNIPDHLIEEIENQLTQKEKTIQAAYFKKINKSTDLSYDSFSRLIKIIEAADFIIGADSLPIHICNLLQKPHYILYPTGYTKLFMTPFAKTNQLYGQFDYFDLSILQ